MVMNENEVKEIVSSSITMRRAARRAAAPQDQSSAHSVEPIAVTQSVILPEIVENNPSKEQSSQVPANQPWTKEMVLEAAQKLGLAIKDPEKSFIKHTYSVTKEHKDLFKTYCDSLNFKMQDALYEAFNDWFTKHKDEFTRINEAKGLSVKK